MGIAAYSEKHFQDIAVEIREMLVQVGWKRELVENQIPIIPVTCLAGDNLVKQSDQMPWWKGCKIEKPELGSCIVTTAASALNDAMIVPRRNTEQELRMPI